MPPASVVKMAARSLRRTYAVFAAKTQLVCSVAPVGQFDAVQAVLLMPSTINAVKVPVPG
jgi:hypothetical protein